MPTSKQPQAERLKDWYPYYAGFPSDFATSVLENHFSTVSHLVDPWNGTGTTTTVAARRGLRCAGFDINPAVTVVARARLTPTSVRDSLEPIADEILVAALRDAPEWRDDEPLARWFRRPAVANLRRLQGAVNAVVVGDPDLELDLAMSAPARTTSLPILASFFYTALFAAVRDFLAPFRTSNPTWTRYPTTYRHRINPSSDLVAHCFRRRVRYLADRLTLSSDNKCENTSVSTGSALHLEGTDVYDACFSSPPYATRVDYVRSTLAELSVLGLTQEDIGELRRKTTGTPLVRGVERSPRPLMSATARAVIKTVNAHESHGSANYYGPWLYNYLTDLEASLSRIDSAVQREGPIGLVVQDSHYKAIHIDLQRIITEAMTGLGRALIHRVDYDVRHSFVHVNSAARRHLAERNNVESLLIYS